MTDELTEQEVELLELTAQGKTQKEIAYMWSFNVDTIYKRLQAIRAKMKVPTDAAAVAVYARKIR